MKKTEIIKEIKKGKIFVYPTDTIYGLGCDATNIKAVNKIKKIKSRDKNKPLSVIAPSKSWIKEHCIVDKEAKLNRYLPGPYTLLLKKKNKRFLYHVSDTEMLGIRIPDNKLTKVIQSSGKPFITTSVNLSGQRPIKKVSEIPESIEKKVDYTIDIGPLTGNPSTFVINGKEIER